MSMKMKWALALATAFILLCFVGIANAQTVSRSVKVGWVLPTAFEDGTPLAASSITKIQVYLGVGPIADNATVGPTVEVTPTPVPITRSLNVSPGGKVYLRLRACVVDNCSALSTQATLDIPVSKPGVPTSITIELVTPIAGLPSQPSISAEQQLAGLGVPLQARPVPSLER
jgi:hypothetical protein